MSDLVIKVKYGDTLRRFCVVLYEDGFADLNMGGLSEKILNLFKFAPDTDLTLTYIDEDNDVVTLVDDDDLRDAIRQYLNPLRINVLLNSARAGRSDTRSSRNSTPLRSPRIRSHPLSRINSNATEVLKSMPEPLRDAVSKLSYDMASKATASAPLLTDILEYLSKLGLTDMVPASQCQDGAIASSHGGVYESPIGPKLTEHPESSKDSVAIQKVLSNAEPVNVTLADNIKDGSNGNVTRSVGLSVPKITASMDLNLDPPRDSMLPGLSAVDITVPTVLGHTGLPSGNEKKLQKDGDGILSGKSIASGTSFSSSPADQMMHINPHPFQALGISKPPFSAVYTYGGPSISDGDNSKQLPTGFGHSSASRVGFNSQNNCAINGQMGVDTSDVVPPRGNYRVHPSKRIYGHCDSMGRIFHKGVVCDSCGVHPITGPRFKSKVKVNYDLCSICYSEMGNEAEYTRMDRPMSYGCPWLPKDFYDPFQHHQFQIPSQPHILQGRGLKPCQPKLDSCFIHDVSVIDGTMMAPATPFTKIWRMRNIGTVAWPRGTQLVWIGGDQFTDRVSVELETPVDGFPVDKELDIAVDFRAPQRTGFYISNWRMASPSGQKFGQRVWVLIQVVTSIQDSTSGSFHSLNLNLPPESSGMKGREIIDVNVEPVDLGYPVSGHSNMATELVPVVDECPNKDRELEFPVDNSLLVGNGVSLPVPPEEPASISYPIIDLSEVPEVPFASPAIDMETATEAVTEGSMVEQSLLKELEEMGFKQINLNREILRRNEYNMEQSVDDLCSFAEWEWDPILKELQEMGFYDRELNTKLLIKNDGSIKQVVMDLIAGEKA